MDPDQSCNRKAGFQRVGNQSILEVERQALHTENLRRIAGLCVTRSSTRVSGRFTVAQVNEQRAPPLLVGALIVQLSARSGGARLRYDINPSRPLRPLRCDPRNAERWRRPGVQRFRRPLYTRLGRALAFAAAPADARKCLETERLILRAACSSGGSRHAAE